MGEFDQSSHSYTYAQYALSPREFVHARDPRTRWVLAPGRTLIICQLAHSRLRTRDTSIYRATNISIRVVFAKAVLDLFILGRSLHRPRGVVYHPRAASHPVALASVCIQGGFAVPHLCRIFLFTKIRNVKNENFPSESSICSNMIFNLIVYISFSNL